MFCSKLLLSLFLSGPINLPTPSPEYYQQNPYITNQIKVEKLPTQPPPKHENPFLATAALQRADVEPRFGEIKTENTRKDTTESLSTLSKGRIARLQEEIFKDQAKNAKYEFASDVVDEINGNDHQREEVRDGLKVVGKYSYRDGYYKRTVHYEADDKGYRVVKYVNVDFFVYVFLSYSQFVAANENWHSTQNVPRITRENKNVFRVWSKVFLNFIFNQI